MKIQKFSPNLFHILGEKRKELSHMSNSFMKEIKFET